MVLPVWIYDVMFLTSFLLVPISLYQTGWFPYLAALLTLYVTLKLAKRYRTTTVSPSGKAVFISGCDTGFGHALAIRLQQTGFRVFAGCLHPDSSGAVTLRETCKDNMFVVPLDVTQDESVKEAEKFVRDQLQDTCLWGVVNNAGVHCIGDIEVTSLRQFQRVFDVNVFGMLRLTKTFLPLIRKSKGRIVVTSSVGALLPAPSFSGYSASKCTLETLTDCLRMEMIKFGVKVSIIQPASFGGNTMIHGGENLKQLINDAEVTWTSSTSDVQTVYGRHYTKSIIETLVGQDKFSCSRGVAPVVDAMEECLTSSNPPYRHLVHGGPYSVDAVAVISSILHRCPDYIKDWIVCRLTGHSDTSNLQGLKTGLLFPESK